MDDVIRGDDQVCKEVFRVLEGVSDFFKSRMLWTRFVALKLKKQGHGNDSSSSSSSSSSSGHGAGGGAGGAGADGEPGWDTGILLVRCKKDGGHRQAELCLIVLHANSKGRVTAHKRAPMFGCVLTGEKLVSHLIDAGFDAGREPDVLKGNARLFAETLKAGETIVCEADAATQELKLTFKYEGGATAPLVMEALSRRVDDMIVRLLLDAHFALMQDEDRSQRNESYEYAEPRRWDEMLRGVKPDEKETRKRRRAAGSQGGTPRRHAQLSQLSQLSQSPSQSQSRNDDAFNTSPSQYDSPFAPVPAPVVPAKRKTKRRKGKNTKMAFDD